jgi:hypothetical protein
MSMGSAKKVKSGETLKAFSAMTIKMAGKKTRTRGEEVNFPEDTVVAVIANTTVYNSEGENARSMLWCHIEGSRYYIDDSEYNKLHEVPRRYA